MKINYSESYIYDPERYEEGQRLYDEAMAKLIMEKIRNKRKLNKNTHKKP